MKSIIKPNEKELIVQSLTKVERKVNNLVIVDTASYGSATNMLGEIKNLTNRLEAKRKEIVTPLNDEVKAVNAEFKTFTSKLNQFEGIIKNLMLKFTRAEEEKRLAEQKRLNALKEKAQAKLDKKFEKQIEKLSGNGVDTSILEHPTVDETHFKVADRVATVDTGRASATAKKVWKFEITNPNEVPREFMSIDETKIREAVRQGVRAITGVRIFEDFNISVR